MRLCQIIQYPIMTVEKIFVWLTDWKTYEFEGGEIIHHPKIHLPLQNLKLFRCFYS